MTNTPSPTDEDRELIAKLRKPDAWSAHIHGNGSFSTVEEAAPFKAADRLESRLAYIAKLEEALRQIASASYEPDETLTDLGRWAVDLARAALNRSPDRGDPS